MGSPELVGEVRRGRRSFSLAALAALVAATGHAQGPLTKLDGFVEQGLRDWKIPGLAVAVVRNDSVVFSRGYGVRQLGRPARVDANTIFAIGSNTKAMTATALAMLVDEGRIAWDGRVAGYLRELEFRQPNLTASVTVRDLLSHRTGLPRSNTLFWGTSLSRSEILRRVRYLPPLAELRSTFQYQNMMYLAAGEIVPAVTGQSWDDFLAHRIFRPLGMTSTSIGIPSDRAGGNVATPHTKAADGVRPIPWIDLSNAAPAGAVNSNLVDMVNWVRLQLGQGQFEGQRLYSEAAAREMQTPQMVVGEAWLQREAGANVVAYGLGWLLYDYRGRKVAEHAGSTDGMSSLVALMPAERLGVVILTNLVPHDFALALRNRIFDAYLGVPPSDWNAEYLERAAAWDRERSRGATDPVERRVSGTTPSLPLAEYRGTYHHDYYGDVDVSWDGSRLELSVLGFKSSLSHWHYDTFAVSWQGERVAPFAPTATRATFVLDALGQVQQVRLRDFFGAFERVVPRR